MSELGDDFSENVDRFVVETIENHCLWGLEGTDGWALCASEKYDDIEVMVLWSARELAACHCRDEWADYQPVAISLEEFLEEWLPGMHKDVLLVGVNWNADLDGEEWEPLDLLQELEQELS